MTTTFTRPPCILTALTNPLRPDLRELARIRSVSAETYNENAARLISARPRVAPNPPLGASRLSKGGA